tara:strand:+ start:465 stop:2402 length:1938 start_codon:yes stop_codon:yes gene_type:complete
MVKKPLWSPSSELINNCNISQFINEVNKEFKLDISSYKSLHDWSINSLNDFWMKVLSFSDIIYDGEVTQVIDDKTRMIGAKWFEGIKLNYAENLLKFNDNQIAIESYSENGTKTTLTYSELNNQVAAVSSYLESIGVREGDRIAAIMPNISETIIMMLASSSLGAIWTSCSPDFGINAILDRFEQVSPKVLLVSDGYMFKGKYYSINDKIERISKQLSSIMKIIGVNYVKQISLNDPTRFINWSNIIKENKTSSINFRKLPFSHPLYIMYSSGTTGKPKSIVHSSGGTLIQHLKELILHVNLNKEDKIFYYTTCGWMMWNWLVSSLSIGSTIVLYEGNPFYPTPSHLLKIADKANINIFGTSAKYIDSLEKFNIKPSKEGRFKYLRTILSTGSPLLDNNFDFVYNHWKKDVQLSSISGGTDIVSCFALGCPILPVYKSELQCIGLGMDVDSYSELGESVLSEKGELVCKSPFPSMPIYFWNDPDNQLYFDAYFNKYENIWTHGDYILVNKHGGVIIYGRSDSTLNPGGVRIGTSEIYEVVEKIKGIIDCVAIGKKFNNDEQIILFVKMNVDLDENIKTEIFNKLRFNCSPRHIPYRIIQVEDIPYTLNGKKVEVAIKKIINDEEVLNKDSIVNPESLDFFKKISI